MTFSIQLPAAEASAQKARKIIRTRLGDKVSKETLNDLLTVVSELVANAVVHGNGSTIGLALRVGGDGEIAGEVQNKGQGRVEPRPVEIGRSGGMGLHIVDALADRWDVKTNSITRVSFLMQAG